MGEGQGRAGDAGGWLFEPEFNRAIKLRQADPRITSNAGAFLLREADHRLGRTASAISRSNCSASISTPWRWATRTRTIRTRWPTTRP
jgi:hypothetical protein